MMTHTHLLASWAVARRLFPRDRAARAAACAGAVWPDLYYWWRGAAGLARDGRLDPAHVDAGRPTRWPDQALHSLLPPAALLAAAAARRRPRLGAFAGAWAAHVLADIPLHDGSARPPLAPLSRWRFRSRLATDEAGHHAAAVLAGEAALCLAALISAHQHVKAPVPRQRMGRRQDHRAMCAAFLRNPRGVGTLWATGDASVRTLLNLAGDGWDALPRVVELGGGTGAITGRILERAAPQARVDVFERDQQLHAMLGARFGGDRRVVLHRDAGSLAEVLGRDRAPVIVSALPFTSMPPGRRRQMLAMLGRCLAPDGVLVAIQYSRHTEPTFREHFTSVTYIRRGPFGFPVLYRLAAPREAARA
jgi:phospholipid N-methyltransferase